VGIFDHQMSGKVARRE